MTESNAKGLAVTELSLQQVKIPALITHHRNDGCKWTLPEGAERIRATLTSAPVVELRLLDGGDEKGNPCNAMSYHGYLGIEDQVLETTVAFIKANSRSVRPTRP
jgi:hypothetical protein